jgi:prophage regulatory protein
MAPRLLTFPQLAKFGISYTRQHIARMERAGRFPKRVQLAPGGRVCWHQAEIEDWLASRPRVESGTPHQQELAARARERRPG